MSRKKEVAVLMPFHKQEMSESEVFSFKNNCQKLKGYPIYLLLPSGLSAAPFLKVTPRIKVAYFSKHFFDSYFGSNQFWIQSIVYDYFKDYKYILKCELDAYVFRDELTDWCNEGYDFIGAPWVNNFTRKRMIANAMHSDNFLVSFIKKQLNLNNKDRVNFVGNGGFSLRNVTTFRLICRFIPWLVPNVHSAIIQEDCYGQFMLLVTFRSSKFLIIVKQHPSL